jgi:hypothetical protein
VIDYRKFKSIYHRQKNKFGVITNHNDYMGMGGKSNTELYIQWDDGGITHLYASQYLGKFFDRYDFFENLLTDKEKLAILLKHDWKN